MVRTGDQDIHSQEPATDHTNDSVTPRTPALGPPSPTTMSFWPLRIHWTLNLGRRSDPEVYQLALALRGFQKVTHAGQDTALEAGEMVLYDSSWPFRTVAASRGPVELIQVQIPKTVVPLAPGRVARLIGGRFSSREGIGALLADFLTRLVQDAQHYRPADATRLGGILLDLLTALLTHELEAEACLASESLRRSLMLRIESFIERHLGDVRLSPQAVAVAHQVSVSYLYKLFRTEGMTVAGWIRERRLENCRRDLADPAMSSCPVHTIATRWGFASNAHFSRAFRTTYGVTPTEYRHAAVHGK